MPERQKSDPSTGSENVVVVIITKNMLTKTEKKQLTNKIQNWVVATQIFLEFSPLFGEDSHFDEHIFQRGWFNHQLEKIHSVIVGILDSADLSVFCWELEILQIPIQLGRARSYAPEVDQLAPDSFLPGPKRKG